MSNIVAGGPFGWIKRLEEDEPTAPAPVEMPTADSETVRLARLREMRKMVSMNKGQQSTLLGGATPAAVTPVTTAPASSTLGGA
jgi:hypothetical protein